MDLKERLKGRHRQKEYATTWKPDAGEMLMGTLEKMDEGTTSYGECKIAHVRTENGTLMGVWLFHKVLKSKWREHGPTPGDEVGIIYHGMRDGESFSYHDYSVEVEEGDLPASDDRPAVEVDAEAHDRPAPSMDNPNADLPY